MGFDYTGFLGNDDYDPEGNGYSGLPGYGTNPNSGYNDPYGGGFGNPYYLDPSEYNFTSTPNDPNDYGNMSGYVRGFQPNSGGSSGYQNLAGQGGNAILRMLQGNGADLSSVLGAFSQGERNNRVLRGNLTQRYDQLMMEAERNRNANESDALKKSAQTSYILGGGSHFTPPNLSINGRTYNSPDLGFGPPPVSESERRGASTLQPQLERRLAPGGSYTPTPVGDYANPGTLENIGSYGAAGVGGLGAIASMMPNRGGQQDPNGGPDGQGGNTGGSAVNSAQRYASQGLAGLGTYNRIRNAMNAGNATGANGSWSSNGTFTGPSSYSGNAVGGVGETAGGAVNPAVTSGLGAASTAGSGLTSAGLLASRTTVPLMASGLPAGGTGLAGAGSSGATAGSTGAGAAGSAATWGANLARFGGGAAGAAAAAYQLAQNRSGMSNTLAGASGGASIGTMIMPGWGTAIGAGVGAAYGALQSWLTVTQNEHDGRAIHEEFVNRLGSEATDQQKQEAENAAHNGGWADPRQALSLIVVRDALARSGGMDGRTADLKAQALMRGLYDAQGGGLNDMQEAFSPIAQIMANQYGKARA